MKTMHIIAFLSLYLTIVTTQSGFAMIQEVPLNKLVHSSELIVVANVEIVKTVGLTPYKTTVIANLIKVENSIKGNTKAGDKIKIKTFGRIEDFPTFNAGSKLLLFLNKVKDHYEVNYGIQGCWPIKNGIITGMGTGKTIEDIKKEIATPIPEKKISTKKPIQF